MPMPWQFTVASCLYLSQCLIFFRFSFLLNLEPSINLLRNKRLRIRSQPLRRVRDNAPYLSIQVGRTILGPPPCNPWSTTGLKSFRRTLELSTAFTSFLDRATRYARAAAGRFRSLSLKISEHTHDLLSAFLGTLCPLSILELNFLKHLLEIPYP